MTGNLRFSSGTALEADVAAHLHACDGQYIPPLSSRIDIDAYAVKIVRQATLFEAWHGAELAGLVAAYLDKVAARTGFVTNVSVVGAHRGAGLAATLMSRCIAHAKAAGLGQLVLEVSDRNGAALELYRKLGFKPASGDTDDIRMRLDLTETQV